MEAANSARPLPHFDYVPTRGGHRPEWYRLLVTQSGSRRYLGRTGAIDARQRDLVAAPCKGQRPNQQLLPLPMQPIPGEPSGLRNRNRLLSLGRRSRTATHDRTPEAAECQKILQKPAQPLPRDEECLTEVVATIAAGYAEGMTRYLPLSKEPGTTVPTIVFGGKEAPRFASPHNDPLVFEIKITSVIVQRILIDTGSSDCLKKLTHPGRNIIALVHSILGFGGQEVNPTGMIRLLVCFSDKLKSKNLEVDFLIVDVPTANNVILRRPTLHKEERRKSKEKEGGLHIKLSIILMTLLLRSLGLSIQGVSYLIPCTLTFARSRNKFHLLRVTAFVLGSLALVYVVEVGLEIDILLKFLNQRHEDFEQIPQGIGPALLIALFLGLSHPFSPRAFKFSQRRWYRVASASSLRHFAVALTPRVNASAIVTSSSVILVESEVPKVAKSQDVTKVLDQ
ncbi:hypothetical protein Cgig2_014113 [Carnegiea gigantea]|uniref:Peptidase A2 domain-containing protein n=1 Tax=Carnegiea gigantea TaxID=171969 RepID=A0A9Q1KYX0_9CARY|nr:hypothetical protein Cgig2_014113 [Carnegiea gigantea]